MPSLNTPTYIGIDPGASGGVAILKQGVIVAVPMPDTETDIWDCFDGLRDKNVFAVIERVTGYVGGAGNTGSSMFQFGTNYGCLRMALIAAKIPFEEVMPQVWQKGLQISKRKPTESKTEWKNRLKAGAQRLFPDTKITLACADAILIAEFCRRKREGKL